MKTRLNDRFFAALLLLFVWVQACETSGDEDPGNGNESNEVPELADLVGRWGISQTEDAQGNSTIMEPCSNSLEIWAGGEFLYVNVAQGSWLEGTIGFDQADSAITLSSGTDINSVKMLAISSTELTLQFEEDGNPITQRLVLLGQEDCAAFDNSSLHNKWSINELSRDIYEGGTLLAQPTISDIPENLMTLDFQSDGSLQRFDYVNEYRFDQGAFRLLDNHNMVIDFNGNDEDPGTLVHINRVQWPYWIMETVTFNPENDQRVVTRFSMSLNSDEVPVISNEDILGKWSASHLQEQFFNEGNLEDQVVFDQVPHNQLTLQFNADATYSFIDLVRSVVVMQGSYELLDGSNVVLYLSDHHHGNDDDKHCPDQLLFHLDRNESGQRIRLTNYQYAANNGNDSNESGYELDSFALSLTKNTGDEPGIGHEQLMGPWQISGVTDLRGPGHDPDEGPQEGMVLNFSENGSGDVLFEQQVITGLNYNMLDRSNLMITFQDDNSDEEEQAFNVFHIEGRDASLMELVIFSPSRTDEDQQEAQGGAEFRVVLEKL